MGIIRSSGPELSTRAGLEKLIAVAFETTGDERGKYDISTSFGTEVGLPLSGKRPDGKEESNLDIWGMPESSDDEV